MGQRSFFDVENRLQSVSKMGDPLERLDTAVPWESFRSLLGGVHEKERKSNAGRKPIDVVLMFKIPTRRSRNQTGLIDYRLE
jgi:transposase, IS5 family